MLFKMSADIEVHITAKYDIRRRIGKGVSGTNRTIELDVQENKKNR